MVHNGRVLEGIPIAVDHWALPKSHDKYKTYLYFLTHLHTDHTKGLTSTWTETIYTSPLNRDLAIQMLKVNPELLKPLELGVGYTLTLPAEHENSEVPRKIITVTLIDANHIKGSVMFLFEGFFGRVLYTGDFRWCDAMKLNPYLKSLAENENLSLLYVDNTFEEVGCEFPTREECVNEVLQIVKKMPYYRIIIGCQTIGKEDVLPLIAQLRKEKVYVPEKTFEIYKLLGMPMEYFTTDQQDCSLRVEKLYKVSQYDLKQKNVETPTIAIRLTASGLLQQASKSKKDELMFNVLYSNHSSSSELADFLNFLKPRLVERIVKNENKPASSVVDRYLATIKAEMTDDSSSLSDSMEVSSFDDAPFKSQMPDYFHSAVSRNQSPKVPGTEETALTEDMDSVVFSSPSISVAQQKPLSVSEPMDLEGLKAKAANLITSIESDLDEFDEDHIYTEAFIAKLISLTKLYEPVTGISLNIGEK